MPSSPRSTARRCAVCGAHVRDGVVCPEHRAGSPDGNQLSHASRRTVEELRLEDMSVPRAYQRELKEALVRRIIREFDDDLLGLLVVVRDSEGELWILDGQHRWMALVELEYETALCEVLHEVPLPRQAAIFSGRNSHRRAPHPRDAFRADYVAGDPTAVAIVSTLDKHGYQPPFGRSKASAIRFICVSALQEVHGWGLLERTVGLIHDAWSADDLATQAAIVTGLAAVLRLYPGLLERELGIRLARRSATEVLRLASASHSSSLERRLWVHVASVVVELYNHARTSAHRLPPPQIPYDAAKRWKDRGR